MKVIVDENIPYIKKALEAITDNVIYISGRNFTPELIKDADALIIRTRTYCNKSLLEGSKVQFIATATIGFDHIDTKYCQEAGIKWTNAPGCNASSVSQYIESTLILLCQLRKKDPNHTTIGIVGVGNVGSKVLKVARQMGMRVLLNDPPLQENQKDHKTFDSIQSLAEQCDILTFHVPLNMDGKYKTYHLGNAAFFASLKRRPVIINTSRGEVLESQALIRALEEGKIENAIIDVWENEPNINLDLLNKVFISTPHIAGYSADGKANATRMSLEALCKHFGISTNFEIVPPNPPEPNIYAKSIYDAYLQIYDPRQDSKQLKEHPELFEKLRGNYPLRREKDAYTIRII